MIDDVHGLVDLHVVRDVVIPEPEGVVAQVLDVRERPRLEVVHTDNAVPLLEQRLAEMRAEKACPARDHRGRHRGRSLAAPAAGPVDANGFLT